MAASDVTAPDEPLIAAPIPAGDVTKKVALDAQTQTETGFELGKTAPAAAEELTSFDESDLDDLDLLADANVARRAKTLACTVPLHEMEASKASVRGGEFKAYTTWALAFIAIDTVCVHMDFDRGADASLVVQRMLPYAARQAPDAPLDEHRAVCEWVLDRLIGTTEERKFKIAYGDYENGEYVEREFPFALITEAPDREGHIFLRATDEAINVLIGALDRDIQSAQEAAEAKLQSLVKRNRLGDAQEAAKAARYQTLRLQEHIRQQLAATERDLRNVDWDRLSEELADALDHVEARVTTEQTIERHLVETRENTVDVDLRRKATAVIDVLRDCVRRHRQLHRVLQGAREKFLVEQSRQVFAAPTAADLRAWDITADLLVPVLKLGIGAADRPLTRFFSAASGLRDVRLGTLESVIDTLLAPPAVKADLGEEIVEAELCDITPPPRFTDAQHDAAERILMTIDEQPCRLSDLLDGVSDTALAQLLCLHAGYAYSAPLHGSGAAADLVAHADGTPLPDSIRELHDIRGDDLVLARATRRSR
jgi:hypothetical protein